MPEPGAPTPSEPSAPEPGAPKPSRRRAIGFGAFIALSLVGCVLALSMGWLSPRSVAALARGSGWWGALILVGLVVVMEMLWLPRMWATVAAAMLFGTVRGALIAFTADSITAILCFFIARGVGRGWVERLVAERPKARRVVELLVERRGAITIAVLRLVPVAHYTLVSYLAGLVGVRPRAYIVGNTLGLVPAVVVLAMVGGSALRPTSPMFLISMGVLVLALIATVIAGRRILR